MLVKKNALLSAAVLLALAACGGSSYTPPAQSSGGQTTATSSGNLIDGYLVGSQVFCDTNNDGILQAAEMVTTTGASGDFTFATACTGTVVGSGGVDKDTGVAFTGLLKAPAGSSVVTPLTSLLASGMTLAEVNAFLGLPPGTDVTKIDPTLPGNEAVGKKTLAMQAMFQQLTDAFGTGLDPAAFQMLFTSAVQSMAAAAKANPGVAMFGADGKVNATMAQAAVNKAAEDVKNSSNPFLAAAAAAAATFDASSFATSMAANASALADPNLSTAQLLALNKQKAEQAAAAKAAADETFRAAHFFALEGDAITVNGTKTKAGTPVTLAEFATGKSITGLTSIGLPFDVARTGNTQTSAAVFLELTEKASDTSKNRKLQVMIDNVTVKVAANQLSVEPAAGAKVFVYGRTADTDKNGAPINAKEMNLSMDIATVKPLTVVDNKITLNFEQIVQNVLSNNTGSTVQTTAEKFTNISGAFDTKIVVSNLNIRHDADGAKFETFPVTVTGTTRSLSGYGIAGSLTVNQPQ